LTRLKSNRQIRVSGGSLQAVSEAGLTGGNGTLCWLKGFGEIKVFRVRATDDASEYWATSLPAMTERERETQAKVAWRIEMYHRALKQQCLIERAQCRRLRPVLNHIGLCYQSLCANRKSLLSRKNQLDRSQNQYYSRCRQSLFSESALFASANCVSPIVKYIRFSTLNNWQSYLQNFVTFLQRRIKQMKILIFVLFPYQFYSSLSVVKYGFILSDYSRL
jgi:hypothetical protein